MGTTVSLIVIGLIAVIALGLAIAALVEAVEIASPQNFFKINRSPGFYSMYGATVLEAKTANSAISILGGSSVGENVIPANFLKSGACFVVQANGVYEGNGGAQSVSMALSIAPAVIVTWGPNASLSGRFPWSFTAYVTCTDVSNVRVSSLLNVDGQVIQAQGNNSYDVSNKQTIDVTAQFSTVNDPVDRFSTTSVQEYFIFEQLKTLLWP